MIPPLPIARVLYPARVLALALILVAATAACAQVVHRTAWARGYYAGADDESARWWGWCTMHCGPACPPVEEAFDAGACICGGCE